MAITNQHLQELIEEFRDLEVDVLAKVQKAAELVRGARHMLVLTGAGISTSAGISCYRGPDGLWTCKAQGRLAPQSTPIQEAKPTATHMALVALQSAGMLGHLGSQNVDGLHVRSGIDLKNITEIHGNMFKEWCPACGIEYIREEMVHSGSLYQDGSAAASATAASSSSRCTGNLCDQCQGPLSDTVINFEDAIRAEHLDMLFAQAASADLCLVLGTSLAVKPFNELPRDVKARGGSVIIVNMQRTPLDSLCDDDGIRVFAETDGFMENLLQSLSICAPQWDPSLATAQKRHRQELEAELAARLSSQATEEAAYANMAAGFCIVPSATCPHASSHCSGILNKDTFSVSTPCAECGNVNENWLCGECHTVHCGRYVCGHMLRHAKDMDHCIGFSLRDSSVWCFACDCYVDEGAVEAVQPLYQQIYFQKHGEYDPRPLLLRAPESGGA